MSQVKTIWICMSASMVEYFPSARTKLDLKEQSHNSGHPTASQVVAFSKALCPSSSPSKLHLQPHLPASSHRRPPRTQQRLQPPHFLGRQQLAQCPLKGHAHNAHWASVLSENPRVWTASGAAAGSLAKGPTQGRRSQLRPDSLWLPLTEDRLSFLCTPSWASCG